MKRPETLTDKYLIFINSLHEVGKTASGELRSCNFTDEDEKTVKESIAYYNMQLSALQNQLTAIENNAKDKFGWLQK